jgi:hypothetical protein
VKSGNYIRLVFALIIMISAAIYQRMTGPTHPVDIDIHWQGIEISGQLPRSHDEEMDQPIEISIPDTSVHAILIHRRFKTDDKWIGMKMERQNGKLIATLPLQPPAGKLEYFIQLKKGNNDIVIPQERMLVTRFTGFVPRYVLIPHIVLMFIVMLLSTWAGLEAASNSEKMYLLTYLTTLFLFIGGMILGPIVQKFAFDEFWTGVPFGFDLTDNKTLVAMIAWAVAAWAVKKQKSARLWILVAAIVLLIVYSIPHSVMGSELDYKTMQISTGE